MTQIDLKCNTRMQQTLIIHSATQETTDFSQRKISVAICRSKIHQGVLIYFLCINKLPIKDIKGLEAGYTILSTTRES